MNLKYMNEPNDKCVNDKYRDRGGTVFYQSVYILLMYFFNEMYLHECEI